MRFLLLVAAAPLAAFALTPAPAMAEHPDGSSAKRNQFEQFAALPSVHRGIGFGTDLAAFDGFDRGDQFHNMDRGRGHDRDRHDGRRRHRGDRGDVITYSYYDSDGWALYNNRSWEPDSFNDWWHDRPDRAYPRWVQEQRGGMCEPDRMWWSGSGWRC